MLLAVLVNTGCGPSVDLPQERTWTSDFVRYHSRQDDTVCAPIVATVERHARLLLDYLSLELPASFRLEYYKYADFEDLERSRICPDRASACASENAVFTWRPLDRHELTHAYLGSLLGPSTPFIEEGAAAALSCELAAPNPVFEGSWQEAFATPYGELDETHYAMAGRFAGYLLNRFGPKPFLDLYRALDHDSRLEAVEASFLRSYGTPLIEAWDAARALDNPELGCVRLWECAGTELPRGVWQPLATDCAQDDGFRVLEVPEDAHYVYQSVAGEWTRLVSCAPEHPAAHEARAAAGSGDRGAFVLPLEPGRYFLTTASPGWAVRVDGPVGGEGSTCDAAREAGILASNLIPGVTLYASSAASWFWIGGLDRAAPAVVLELSDGLAAQICRTCVDGHAGDCAAAPRSQTLLRTSEDLFLQLGVEDGFEQPGWLRMVAGP